MTLAVTALTSTAQADEPRPFTSLMASPAMCTPGAQAACSCPGGGQGTQTCEKTGLRFSLCACASMKVDVKVPTVTVPNLPDVTWKKPKKSKSGPRSSGLGMLIGGGVSLLVGTGNLVWGIERLRETKNDPLGIVMISTGGTAMAVGLPLTIVGIAFLATRGLHPDRSAFNLPLTVTPDGFALSF